MSNTTIIGKTCRVEIREWERMPKVGEKIKYFCNRFYPEDYISIMSRKGIVIGEAPGFGYYMVLFV